MAISRAKELPKIFLTRALAPRHFAVGDKFRQVVHQFYEIITDWFPSTPPFPLATSYSTVFFFFFFFVFVSLLLKFLKKYALMTKIKGFQFRPYQIDSITCFIDHFIKYFEQKILYIQPTLVTLRKFIEKSEWLREKACV